ncbi:hypothetical protein I4U23_014969 [Adineta vaga]|nr:hypothetical protein I4U23_014969 [Adineta vaga]
MGCGISKPSETVKLPEKLPISEAQSVENYVVVWFIGSNDQNEVTDIKKSMEQLQQVFSVVKNFTDADQCRAFIYQVKLEKTSLCKKLNEDANQCNHDLIGYEVVESTVSTNSIDSNRQKASFMYSQLFKETILRTNDGNIKDLCDFCRKHYQGNKEEMLFLDRLEKTYPEEPPARWYSYEGCLYRVLSKALRTCDFNALYSMRVIIRDLHKQLANVHSRNKNGRMELYRGQGMEDKEFNEICNNKEGLLIISNF